MTNHPRDDSLGARRHRRRNDRDHVEEPIAIGDSMGRVVNGAPHRDVLAAGIAEGRAEREGQARRDAEAIAAGEQRHRDWLAARRRDPNTNGDDE